MACVVGQLHWGAHRTPAAVHHRKQWRFRPARSGQGHRRLPAGATPTPRIPSRSPSSASEAPRSEVKPSNAGASPNARPR